MKRASITDAKNQLSALLERVRRGDAVVIEDRGVPVAKLVPVTPGTGDDADALARLERQGIIRPVVMVPGRRSLLRPPPKPVRPVALSALVAAERREGR